MLSCAFTFQTTGSCGRTFAAEPAVAGAWPDIYRAVAPVDGLPIRATPLMLSGDAG
jgi:hypothetical protein